MTVIFAVFVTVRPRESVAVAVKVMSPVTFRTPVVYVVPDPVYPAPL